MKTFLLFILVGVTSVLGAHKAKRAAYDLPDAIGLLLGPLRTTFVCDRDGYFADQDNNCQIFHVCHTVTYPDDKTETFQYSFICGNLTIFNQRTFTCTYPENAVPCERAHEYFHLNDAIGDPNSFFQNGEGVGVNSGQRRGGSSSYGNGRQPGGARPGGFGGSGQNGFGNTGQRRGLGGSQGQNGGGISGRQGGSAGSRGQGGIGGIGSSGFEGNVGSRQGGGAGGIGGSRQGGGGGRIGGSGQVGGVGGIGGPGQARGDVRFGNTGLRGGAGARGDDRSRGGAGGFYGDGQIGRSGGGNNRPGRTDDGDSVSLKQLKQTVKKQIESAIKESDKEFKNLEKQIDVYIEMDNKPELRKLRVKVLSYKDKVRDLINQIRSLDWEDDEVLRLRSGAEHLDTRANELITKIDNHLNKRN